MQSLFLNPRFSSFVTVVLAPALVLTIIFTALLAPSILSQHSLNNLDWSWSVQNRGNYTYIDEDFILYNRPFVNVSEFDVDERGEIIDMLSEKGFLGRFYLRDGETAIWRDCIMYTMGTPLDNLANLGYKLKYIETGIWNPETGQTQYSNDTNIGLELASEIILLGSSHLTLINVTVNDYVTIRLLDNASLTMINCTNIGYSWTVITNDYWEWPSGSPGGGIYRRPEGVVEVEGKATVWIEDTTLGRLVGTRYSHGGIKPGYLNTATIINSSIQEVRVRSQTPLRIIDSEIHELYADEGDIELIGTTKVTYLFPFLKSDE